MHRRRAACGALVVLAVVAAVLALAGPPALAAPAAKWTGEMRVSLPEGPLAGSTVDVVLEP